jgi:hypothetical protein
MVSRIIIEGPIVKIVTRSGHGGHIIVPEDWIGKKVRCTIVDNNARTVDQQKQASKLLKGATKDIVKKTGKK